MKECIVLSSAIMSPTFWHNSDLLLHGVIAIDTNAPWTPMRMIQDMPHSDLREWMVGVNGMVTVCV